MKMPKTEPVKTVLTISVGFIIVFLLTQWKWAIIVSLTVGIAGIISDYLSRMIDTIWMKLAKVLSYIVPNIILSLVFYLFLFPIATLSKLFGKKDTLRLKKTSESMFVVSNKNFDKNSFEKPW
jgi:ABC-type multidrug transport system fused ATPase/permease subunit